MPLAGLAARGYTMNSCKALCRGQGNYYTGLGDSAYRCLCGDDISTFTETENIAECEVNGGMLGGVFTDAIHWTENPPIGNI